MTEKLRDKLEKPIQASFVSHVLPVKDNGVQIEVTVTIPDLSAENSDDFIRLSNIAKATFPDQVPNYITVKYNGNTLEATAQYPAIDLPDQFLPKSIPTLRESKYGGMPLPQIQELETKEPTPITINTLDT